MEQVMNSHHEFDSANLQRRFDPKLRWAQRHDLADSHFSGRKSRGTRLSQAQFQIETARRRVDQIEGMIVGLESVAKSLDDEIRTEEKRTGFRDPAHFAYPTYAKATIARRDNLNRSADVLKDMLSDAKAALAKALIRAEEPDRLPNLLAASDRRMP
jgi:flagellar protein FliJ